MIRDCGTPTDLVAFHTHLTVSEVWPKLPRFRGAAISEERSLVDLFDGG